MDLQGILEALILFFDLAPSGSRALFVSQVEARGIAVPDETNFFLTYFLATADGIGMIASADFDTMMAKRREVGLEKASNAARVIYTEMQTLIAVRIALLEARRNAVADQLTALAGDLALAEAGRDWIETQAPGSAAIKAATLLAMGFGLQQFEAGVAALTREIAAFDAQIAALQQALD